MPFIYSETPAGAINSSNVAFTLAQIPSPAASLILTLNGAVQTDGTDFTIAGAAITFSVAPLTGDTLLAVVYNYGFFTTTLNFAYNEVPSGAINGSNVTFTLANIPSPTGSLILILNGLVLQQGTDFTLSGVTITMATVLFPGDTLLAAVYTYGVFTTSNATITLQSVANFFSTQADLLPLTGIGGYTDEPFLSIANDALSDLISDPSDWKFNRKELPIFVTCPNKQDYLFAGAVAFTTSQGWAIGLASSNAITVAGGVVTVNTLEAHRFSVGDMVHLYGVIMATGTAANYNATFTDNGASSAWAGGYTIASIPSSTSFTFTAVVGQNNSDVGGAAGITDFAYATSASAVQMSDTASPQSVRNVNVRRELPVLSCIGSPNRVAVISDTGTGTLRFRCDPVPGQTSWGISIVYQAQAPLKTAMTNTWTPFPDHLSSVYRQAVLYRMRVFLNQPTQNQEWTKLQAVVRKALGFTGTEPTEISVKPEDPIMDESIPYFF